MADLFGTPSGTRAAQSDQMEQVLGGMKAAEILGKIQMQPVEMRKESAAADYYQAHARQALALADAKEQENAEARRLGELMKTFTPRAETPGLAMSQPSLADPIARLARLAGEQGLIGAATKYGKAASEIAFKEAEVKAQQALTTRRQVTTEQTQAQMLGGLGASIKDQASWDELRMAAHANPQVAAMIESSGVKVDELPANVNDPRALAIKTHWMGMGTKAADVVAQTTRDAVAKASIAKFSAQETAAKAAAAASSARTEELKQTIELRKKNGGDVSEASRELKLARKDAVKAGTDAREAERLAKEGKQRSIDAARFPAPTPEQIKDPTKRTVGQTYMTPKGPMTWSPTGWVPLRPQGVVAAPAAEEDDDADTE